MDLDLGPQTINHLCEYSFHGNVEMEAQRGDAQERMESIGHPLEAFDSVRMEDSGMVD